MAVETLYAASLSSGSISTPANALGAPNDTWTTDADNTSWTAVFTMDAPVNNNLDGNQTVVVRARKETGSGTPTLDVTITHPTLGTIGTASGVSLTAGGTGQDVTVNCGTITGVSSAGVTVSLTGTASGGGPAVRSTPQIDGITWTANTSTAATNYNATASVTGTGAVSATAVVGVSSTATVTGTGAVDATGSVGGGTTNYNVTATVTGTGAVDATAVVDRSTTASVTGTGAVTATGSVGTGASFTVTMRHVLDQASGNAQTGTTSSTTPTADSLLLAFYGAEADSHATLPTLPAPTGGGLSFTLVNKDGDDAALQWDGSTNFHSGSALYRAQVGASPTAHTLVVDAYATTALGYYCAGAVDVIGHDTTNPVVQEKVNGAGGIGPSDTQTGTVTLDAAPTSGNLLVVGIFAAADSGGAFTAPTAGAGKTMTTHLSQNNGGFVHLGIWSRVCDGTESATITSTDLGQQVGAYIFHAVEIRPPGGGGGLSTSASVTGTGTVSATAVVGKSSTATVTGTGSVAASGVKEVASTAAVTGTGAVTATAVVGKTTTATVAGTGAVDATGSVSTAAGDFNATATVTGTGTVSATGQVATATTATVTGTGSVAATAVVGKSSNAAVTGTGTVSASAVVGKTTTATVTGTGAVSSTGSVGAPGALSATASATGTGTVSATAAVGKTTTATVTGVGTVSATGVVGKPATSTVTGTGTVSATAVVGKATTVTVTGTGSVTASSVVIDVGAAVDITFQSVREHQRTVTITDLSETPGTVTVVEHQRAVTIREL